MTYKNYFLTILLVMLFSSSTHAEIKQGDPAPVF